MTGEPGWYADPDRVLGRQRWWDGQAWGDVTRGGPAAVPPGSAPGAAPAWRPVGVQVSDRPTYDDVLATHEGRRSPAWLLVTLAVVAALVVALVVGLSGREESPVLGPGTAFPTFSAPPTQEGDLPPGTVRIIDPEAGISYAYLGEGWKEIDTEQRAEMRTVHGQYIVTQETVPDGGTFIAEATSGLLAEAFGTPGPGGYADLAEPLAASFRANYYPAPNEQNVLVGEALTVAGRPAYLLEFDLRWEISGYDSTGERAALLIMDTGKAAPAVVFISVPNTHAELYGIIDRLIASIELL